MHAITFARSGNTLTNLHLSARRTHQHVLGLSNQGKSYLLEHQIRKDIIAGHGVCVIDPHGELYDNLVHWLASTNRHRLRRVHLLNPSDGKYTFGFNPLCLENGTSLEYRVDAMVDACVKVWGGEDVKDTPRLAKCLTAVFHALAANKLSLAEARFLTSTHLRDVTRQLVKTIENPDYKSLWYELLATDPKTFGEYFESTTSRLITFVGNPVVKDIVGQTKNLINFRECMEEGHIVLVNLKPGGTLSMKDSNTLGALIANDLYTTSFSRDPARAKFRPYFFYLDEMARYLTQDIVNSLDECRKYGIHLILSHQRIWQLREYGDNFYNAVMANAQLKVMFKAGDEETADIMSRHFFRTSFDLEQPKHTMDKPYTVGHRREWFEGYTRSNAEIEGLGSGEGTSSGLNSAMSQLYSAEGEIIGGYTASNANSTGSITSSNRFEAQTSAWSENAHQALVPEIEFLPTELYKLDELIHLGMVKLLSLQPRQAFVCGPGLAPFEITTLDVEKPVLLKQFAPRRVTEMNERSSAISTRKSVRDAMATRAYQIEEYDSEPIGETDGMF